jgi:hypothetical protein
MYVLDAFWTAVGAAEPFPSSKEVAAMGRDTLFDVAMDVVGRSDPPLLFATRDEYKTVFLSILDEIGKNRKMDIPKYPTESTSICTEHPSPSVQPQQPASRPVHPAPSLQDGHDDHE